MRKSLLLIAFSAFVAFAAFAADDPWLKLKEIKSGTELRVFKRGSTQPLLVKMDEATEERLVIVNKNEQTSIAREEIDQVDARPTNKRPVTKETKASAGQTPGSSGLSSSLSIGSKPDFETVYRRPVTPPKR